MTSDGLKTQPHTTTHKRQICIWFLSCAALRAAHLKPAFGHEEVVLDALFPKLLGSVEAHGAVLVVDLALVLIAEDGVGVVDLFELFRSFRVVGVLVRMMPQCEFPRMGREDGGEGACRLYTVHVRVKTKT